MIRALFSSCLAILVASVPAAAFEMRAPTEEVVLVVSGEIAVTNQGDTAAFDRSMLEDLGGDIIVTSTIWTDGVSEFEGVKLSTLAKLFGIESGVFVGYAINDYSVEIPVSDAYDHQPIIALPITVVQMQPDHARIPTDQCRRMRRHFIVSTNHRCTCKIQ